jgi:hypothetical protein
MDEIVGEVQRDGLWIDEQIWGHRLHDEQSPWLTFLEFLTVFHALSATAFQNHRTKGEQLKYTPQRQIRLRNILFNNPHFVELKELSNLSSDEAWSLWFNRMSRNPSGDPTTGLKLDDLRQSFATFQDFVRVVEYFRRTSVEGLANKRWTTRFVFPFGANALYEDLAEKGKSFQTDRLFFARTGELLYLMLCRAKRSNELAEALRRLFFHTTTASEQLVGILQGTKSLADTPRTGAYLPHETRPEFDMLAADWLALLNRGMPGLDVVPHLVTIGALHLWRYFLNLAAERLGQDRPRVLIEMVGTQRTAIRALSTDSFDQNNALPWRAVEDLLKEVQQRPEWKEWTTGADGREKLLDQLSAEFGWPHPKERRDYQGQSADDIVQALINEARTRHRGHLGKIHGTWARELGLASRRSSRRVRYAPTDRLLKTLVFAHVPNRLEVKSFLQLLYERYGFVIGDIEGQYWIREGQADKEDFKRNAQRLEERLSSLGLAERLSDACAYVQGTGGLGT